MTRLLKEKLQQFINEDIGRVAINESLASHNSWKIGGPADVLVEPTMVEQVSRIVSFSRTESIPLVVIGQGTNLLFDDAGVRGIVMKIGKQLSRIDISGQAIVAQGGVWVPQLARKSMAAGLSGLEHCIGIPGTLGGLVVMNGGSQRHGIGENVVSVTIVDREGRQQKLSRDECQFSYRRSTLQGLDCVVVDVELRCPVGDRGVIRREMLADLKNRRSKFPRKQPNCGSVFLSTTEMHATVGPPGKIIEDAGLKGLRVGNAEISQQHANFIVNLGGASSVDVLTLIKQVRQKVQNQIGFDLDCEVRYVDSLGNIAPAHLQADSM